MLLCRCIEHIPRFDVAGSVVFLSADVSNVWLLLSRVRTVSLRQRCTSRSDFSFQNKTQFCSHCIWALRFFKKLRQNVVVRILTLSCVQRCRGVYTVSGGALNSTQTYSKVKTAGGLTCSRSPAAVLPVMLARARARRRSAMETRV